VQQRQRKDRQILTTRWNFEKIFSEDGQCLSVAATMIIPDKRPYGSKSGVDLAGFLLRSSIWKHKNTGAGSILL
jgi:hypothetical protein